MRDPDLLAKTANVPFQKENLQRTFVRPNAVYIKCKHISVVGVKLFLRVFNLIFIYNKIIIFKKNLIFVPINYFFPVCFCFYELFLTGTHVTLIHEMVGLLHHFVAYILLLTFLSWLKKLTHISSRFTRIEKLSMSNFQISFDSNSSRLCSSVSVLQWCVAY